MRNRRLPAIAAVTVLVPVVAAGADGTNPGRSSRRAHRRLRRGRGARHLRSLPQAGPVRLLVPGDDATSPTDEAPASTHRQGFHLRDAHGRVGASGTFDIRNAGDGEVVLTATLTAEQGICVAAADLDRSGRHLPLGEGELYDSQLLWDPTSSVPAERAHTTWTRSWTVPQRRATETWRLSAEVLTTRRVLCSATLDQAVSYG